MFKPLLETELLSGECVGAFGSKISEIASTLKGFEIAGLISSKPCSSAISLVFSSILARFFDLI